jgi:DNA-binding MarR family transcriptional regulator
VSAPTATKLVGALVEAGLIERHVDPGDRRSALLSLAPAGARRLLVVRREIKSLLARRLATLTPAEREVVARAVPVLELLASSDRD